jgi:hypothetical protein
VTLWRFRERLGGGAPGLLRTRNRTSCEPRLQRGRCPLADQDAGTDQVRTVSHDPAEWTSFTPARIEPTPLRVKRQPLPDDIQARCGAHAALVAPSPELFR